MKWSKEWSKQYYGSDEHSVQELDLIQFIEAIQADALKWAAANHCIGCEAETKVVKGVHKSSFGECTSPMTRRRAEKLEIKKSKHTET